MKGKTIVELTPRPFERIESDVAVAGFFTDERPLRGGIARADWRLCGGLSERIENGDLSGIRGDALLMGCGRALRSPRLLVVGLGDRHEFDLVHLSDEMGSVMRRCIALRCFDIALAPLGVAPDDIPRHVSALVAGIREATEEGETRLRIRFCVQTPEIPAVQRAFEDACKAARIEDIEVRALAASRPPAAARNAPAAAAPL